MIGSRRCSDVNLAAACPDAGPGKSLNKGRSLIRIKPPEAQIVVKYARDALEHSLTSVMFKSTRMLARGYRKQDLLGLFYHKSLGQTLQGPTSSSGGQADPCFQATILDRWMSLSPKDFQ